MMLAMDALRFEQQIEQRRGVDRLDFLKSPVVA
jgi:hypothetical protein